MNLAMKNIFLLLLCIPVTHAFAEPELGSERQVLSVDLQTDLLCGSSDGKDRGGDPESDSFLKSAGAAVIIEPDDYFNQSRYSFTEPLEVDHLPLYSVQQIVGEGGVIFIAEVEGDLSAFVRKVNAQPAKEDDDFLGVSNVQFYKTLKEKLSQDAEPEFTKILIGQNRIQKAQGRFFYGCVETMDLR